MYRVQVMYGRSWRWGLHDYTLDQAEQRVKELKAVGIKARVKPLAELLG